MCRPRAAGLESGIQIPNSVLPDMEARMRVSKVEEYGVRLVMSLAVAGRQLTVRELAMRERLPEPTVAKVVARLRHAELVKAERGRTGGYTLSRRPEDLNLATVLAAFGSASGLRGFCERMSPQGLCVHLPNCTLWPVWRDLGGLVQHFLAQITVRDLIGTPQRSVALAAGDRVRQPQGQTTTVRM